jgi:hypothetical protein
MNKFFILFLIIILVSCSSDKNIKKKDQRGFTVQKEKEHSPWKVINFFNEYQIKCPSEWKVSRDRTRLFLRPERNKPIGVIIVKETDAKINSLSPVKYFVHFYKNMAIPRDIAVNDLKKTTIENKNAIRFDYYFKDNDNKTIKGYQIIVKHNGKFFYIVTEAEKSVFENYSLMFRWITESIVFK